MKSIFDNPAAFAPFFDDTVAVTGTRGSRAVRMTVRACVIEDDDVFPDGESAPGARCRRVRVMIQRSSWTDETQPEVGDYLEVAAFGGDCRAARFHVAEVNDVGRDTITLLCKEVPRA